MDLQTIQDTPPWEWPEGAAEMFLAILRDDQAEQSDRLLATELAGNFTVINDELADALLSIVGNRDEPEHLRAQAAISMGPGLESAELGGFDDLAEDVPITEDTFRKTQESFRKLYLDADVPKEVRRRILEASVRAPQDWHQDAIRSAYAGDDEDWKLTAVFSMGWVGGFDHQILEALESSNPEIHYEAVRAAGKWAVDAAWAHVAALVASEDTGKPLRLAAIEAVSRIRPKEAGETLVDLTTSDDEDIVEAALDAMAMAELPSEDELDDEDDDVLRIVH